jgi:hypothetical protein
MPPLAMKLTFLDSKFGKLRYLEPENVNFGALIYVGALDLRGCREIETKEFFFSSLFTLMVFSSLIILPTTSDKYA